ncbi:DUF2079 domain-containing protein [Citricoccus sp. SGAir0253]|uniref:DUF2079 domain-containing protein n=1 Tax=Citricoccus sp. SGAir0253 TaxID=2567881 RepID=UPI0010CCDBD1|nr:DUF2079 domain-containing protein [Citricoccus sp. SGAir0253]QCU78299.1 DUF2079 domain-containing protein [Citricoccus sp. SGAir0253]
MSVRRPPRWVIGHQPERRDGAVTVGPATTGRQWLQLGAVMAAAAVLYLVHSFLRFRNYEAKGYDLGIFDQAVRQYALLREPIVPIKGVDFNILGDHFHPVLALLAPLYWIWDDPRMLNFAMTALLVSTAVPVYLFARRRFRHATALVGAAALLLWWPFQAMVNWDFHEIAFGVPVLAWVAWAVDGRRYWLATGLAAILLAVREDMGITLLAVALLLALKRAWAPAVVTAVLGVAGYLFATSVVIPHFSPEGEFGYWQFTALGPDMGSSIAFILTRPLEAAAVLFDHPLKVALWLLHLVPLWLLPLLSPYALLAAPVLLSRLFNDRLNVWSPVYQYDAILAPVLLLAALEALARIEAWRVRRRADAGGAKVPADPAGGAEGAGADPDAGPAAPAGPSPRARRPRAPGRLPLAFVSVLLGCGVVGTLAFPQVFPFQRTVTGQDWRMTEWAHALDRAVGTIPDDVCVEAADNAVPHLVDRTYVGLHGDMGDDLATWMIIDTTVEELGGWDPLTPAQALERAERLGYEVVREDDHGIWVLHRDRPVDPVCADYVP